MGKSKQTPVSSRQSTVNSRQSPDLEMSDAPYDLPDGWTWTTIGEACAVNPTMQWPEGFTKNKPVHFVPMSAVDGNTGTIVSPEPRAISEVWKGYKRFQDGDVIFARITPCMENGKAAIAKNLLNGIGLGSTEYHVLRPSENVLAEWIYHFVRQPSFRNEAARAMTGTAGQLRVPADFVKQTSIPLPPFPEQLRIVARIESLFAESRTARDALERVPTLLKRFRQSILASAFRGELTERDPNDEPASKLLERIRGEKTNEGRRKTEEPGSLDTSDLSELPIGWCWARLGEYADYITKGESPKWQGYDYVEKGVPFVRSENVLWGELKYSTAVKIPERFHQKLLRSQLKPSDVLINLVGASIGRSAIVPIELERANINQAVGLIRLNKSLSPEYLMHLLISPFIQDVIHGEKADVARANFGLDDLRALRIPLAPLAEQRRIVAKIESLFAQADAIERAVVIAQQRADKIDQSILARAFRGEL
jgi:type I restriction enzyme S subunit